MARAHFVKKARKDIVRYGKVVVKAGESYWWWEFRNSTQKSVSTTRPRASQLAQSAFYSALYGAQERIEDAACEALSDVEALRDELVSDMENLKDETQGSWDNMPESLQYSPTGELLSERVSGLETLIDELSGVDCEGEEFDEDSCDDEDVESARQEHSDEQVRNALDELANCSWDIS